ncbi:hypothetical protein C8Q78DRAFT_1077038 [Trametes maxima]|nr:hypothetical protein C8Q78DRAFT_1077038 [Trametes maxima]
MSCVTVPTATQFATLTTDSVSTSFSDRVSTLAPTTTTIDSVSCTPITTGNTTTSSCSTVENVSTIAGGTTTVQVPILLTIPITSTSPTATLFSTSCTDSGQVSVPVSTTTTSTTTVVVTTSVPTEITFQSSFTSDGSVIVTSGTSTTVTEVTQTSVLPITTGSSSPSNSSSDTSAIVGGAVGGVVGAVVLSLIAWFFLRKKRRYDFDDELFLHDPGQLDDHPKNVLRKNGEKGPTIDAEPRPYTYGALSSPGPSSSAPTPSTEGPPLNVNYSRPISPPRPPPIQIIPVSQPISGNAYLTTPRPTPSQHTSLSTPSVYSGTFPGTPSPPMTPPAGPSSSTSTITVTAGYDQRRALQVVNGYPSASVSAASVPLQSEKAQIYLHPDRGLTTLSERPEASGSSTYIPRIPGPPQGAGAPPAPIPPSDPSRGPFVHQDAGRAPLSRKATEADAPPAYTE